MDVNAAPLTEVGLLLGHAAGAGEPVVASAEDQCAVFAATVAGRRCT